MTTDLQRVRDRVQHMIDAATNADQDIGNASLLEFLADGKTQRAVIESIIVLGEAANKIMRISPGLAQTHAALWQLLLDANDMRNLLAHEYFRVDAAIVYATVKNNLPELEAQLLLYLSTP